MKQFKIAVHNYSTGEGNDFTVIDSSGNQWTGFPYHLKKKVRPGQTLYFETDGSMTPRTAFLKASEELGGRFGSLEQDLSEAL